MVWCSHLFQNFPQFVVIHTVKGFGIVSKAKVDMFLELLLFLMIQWMLAIDKCPEEIVLFFSENFEAIAVKPLFSTFIITAEPGLVHR